MEEERITDFNAEKDRIMSDAAIALKQLSKLMLQDIDLTGLDPEKAKSAAEGKAAAFEASLKILSRIKKEQGIYD